MRARGGIVALAALALSTSAVGETPEAIDPAVPAILPLRERATLENAWLKERLETIVPALMRAQGFDTWVLVAREYFEEPVIATMLDAESFSARRRTILIFHDPGNGKPVERITVSRYGLGDLFTAAWDPAAQPDQWQAAADLIAARNPKRIAINSSALSAFGDGMTLSQNSEMMATLTPALRARVVATDKLAIGWLEKRTAAEMERYPSIVRTAHAIIAEGLSDKVIEPGKTTTDDVVWWYRERIAGLGLDTWFQPSVAILRQGTTGMIEGDSVIQPGDMLWTDFGITYLGLNTDTQHLAYVLKPGETDAPAGLKAGLAAANRVQDLLTAEFRVGASGNAVLARARTKAVAQGLGPSIYSHPIGFHGHGAGPAIGFWDNQNGDPRGSYLMNPETAWSIELSATQAVPEWGGQRVEFRSEEDAYFDGKTVQYIDGRQTRFHLIRGR